MTVTFTKATELGQYMSQNPQSRDALVWGNYTKNLSKTPQHTSYNQKEFGTSNLIRRRSPYHFSLNNNKKKIFKVSC